MPVGQVDFFDNRLLKFLLATLLVSIGTIGLGFLGVIVSTVLCIGLNFFYYKGSSLTLLFLFIFIGNYSMVWGGNYLFIKLDSTKVNIHLTQISNYLGYFLVINSALRGAKLPKFNAIDLLIILFFLLAILSPVIAPDSLEPLKMVNRFVQYMVLYLMVRVTLTDRYQLEKYFQFHLTSFVPVFSIIVIQFFGGFLSERGEGRPHDLMPFLPYLLAVTLYYQRNTWRFWLLSFASMFLLTFSASRRIILAILGFLTLRLFKSGRTLVILISLIIATPLIYDLLPDYTKKRVDSTITLFEIGVEEGFDQKSLSQLTTHRTDFWLVSLKIFADYPLFGIGVKNQEKYMIQYGGLRNARAHNFYIEVLADMGIIGFTVVLLLIIMTFKRLSKGIKDLKQRSGYLMIMLGGFRSEMVIIHLVAIFGSSMLYSKTIWVKYAIVAVIVQIGYQEYQKSKKQSQKAITRV